MEGDHLISLGIVGIYVDQSIVKKDLWFNTTENSLFVMDVNVSHVLCKIDDIVSWALDYDDLDVKFLRIEVSGADILDIYQVGDVTMDEIVGRLNLPRLDVSSTSEISTSEFFDSIDLETIGALIPVENVIQRRRNLSFSGTSPNTKRKKNQTKKYFTVDLKVFGAKSLKLTKQSHTLKVVSAIGGNVWKTGSVRNNSEPLWEEEFSGKIEQLNSPLNLFLLDNQRLIGSVSINPKEYCNVDPSEEWYPLSYCKRKNFVTGDLRIIISTGNPKEYDVTIFQARNLSLVGVTKDSVYVTIEYGASSKKTKSGKSVNFLPNVIWRDNNVFSFKKKFTGQQMKFTVYGVGKLGKTRFLGESYLDVEGCKDLEKEEKLVLLPQVNEPKERRRSGGLGKSAGGKTGSLRISLSLKKQEVQELAFYKDFSEFVIQNPVELISLLEEISLPEDRVKLAITLVNIYEAKNKATVVLNALITHETQFQVGVDTLFRGNTVGSAAVDTYMRYVGHGYLLEIIRPTVKQIYKEKKLIEIRSDFLDKPEELEKNIKTIKKYLESLLGAIFTSDKLIPNSLKKVFFHLADELEKKFPGEVNIKYIGISGFLFLRLIVAAINSPKLFNIMNENPNPINSKNLTTLAKLILKISSMVDMTEEEPTELNTLISEYQPKMREFIDMVSLPTDELDFNPVPVDMAEELSFLLDYLQTSLPKLRQILSENSTEKLDILALFQILEEFRENTALDLSQNIAVVREFNTKDKRVYPSISSPTINISEPL